jgi:hypothetical protein
MMSKTVRSVLMLFILTYIPFAYVQYESAAVLGTVRDPSAAVVPGATVLLKNMETGISTTAVTDDAGNSKAKWPSGRNL